MAMKLNILFIIDFIDAKAGNMLLSSALSLLNETHALSSAVMTSLICVQLLNLSICISDINQSLLSNHKIVIDI